ncbi:MAG TPA: secretin N-terminal domain-containing protein, partial [Thermoguttaceae bacterium]|nr:secretin N-terminal domain-containing protein [Thermoguttaceae bacterium]
PLRFISDSDTNTILVQGADAQQLKTIEDLIKIYDLPEPTDSQSVRKTQVFYLKYSQATVVAETIKDVYRDLLSDNDKALASSRQNEERRMYFFSDDNSEQRSPKFKGMLSIGVDELSNTLIVSAPMFLFDDVSQLIDQLDEAAEPTTPTVRTVKVNPGLTAEEVRKALEDVLGQGGGSGRGSSYRPSGGGSSHGSSSRYGGRPGH